MPTISGTITAANGTAYTSYVRFTLMEQPQSKGGSVINARPVDVLCNANGQLSVVLVSGSYMVEQREAKPYRISFGDGASYDLADLIGAGAVGQVATPSISPDGGIIGASQIVTLTCATVGASMYYTTDGTAPDTGDTPYTAPFEITSGVTVKAVGVMSGYINSLVRTAVFTQELESLVYYGKSLVEIIDEAGVLALSSISKTSAIGDYVYGADDGYSYFAAPAAWSTPTTMKLGGLDIPIWQTAPYDSMLTPLIYYMPLTIGATPYRVIRSYYSTPGAWTLTVT
jgi:hypothetical protein